MSVFTSRPLRRSTAGIAFLFFTLCPHTASSEQAADDDSGRDETQTLQSAINALPAGGTMDFGGAGKTHLISRSLILKPNATYSGGATIRMSSRAAAGSQIALLLYGKSDDVTLDGLTFDGNHVGGGLAIAVNGGGDHPAQNVSITNMKFRNMLNPPRGAQDSAVYNPVGWTGGKVANNSFTNCGSGISVANAQNLVISDNTFTSITVSNAIFIVYKPVPFASGKGVQILRNRGRDLGRIAIEMWSPQRSALDGPVIADNSFSDWRASAHGMFGISVMTGVRAQITNNTMTGGVAGLGYGIELGAPYSRVEGNTVRDFSIGVAMQESHDSVVYNNTLINQEKTGIEISNAPGSKNALTIENNNIQDAKHIGILVNTPDWGASTLSGNRITRAGGRYPEDNTTEFTGIGMTPAKVPVNVLKNTVTQTSVHPPPGFGFIGIRLNGRQRENQGCRVEENVVKSAADTPVGVGLMINGPGSEEGVGLSGNRFEKLKKSVTGIAPARLVQAGSAVVNCSDYP